MSSWLCFRSLLSWLPGGGTIPLIANLSPLAGQRIPMSQVSIFLSLPPESNLQSRFAVPSIFATAHGDDGTPSRRQALSQSLGWSILAPRKWLSICVK